MRGAVPIDWRRHERSLRPYVDGLGGVVHVQGRESAAVNIFANALCDRWLADCDAHQWVTCRLDPSDQCTRYPRDMADVIADLAGFTLPTESQTPIEVTVLSGNRARRIETGDITVLPPPRNAVDRVAVEALCAGLKDFLRHRRIALVFPDLDKMEPEHRRQLGSTLWAGRLEDLLAHGLLVVVLYDKEKLSVDAAAFPPPPDLVIQLPDYLDVEEDWRAAQADLAAIALERNWRTGQRDADLFADSLIGSNDTMTGLHVSLSTYGLSRRGASQ